MPHTNPPDLLLIGPSKPLLAKGLEPAFTVHKLIEAKDREAFLAAIADRVRAFAVTYTNQKIDAAIHAAVSEARNRVEFRGRLRPHRCQMGRRPRRPGDQHARRAQRGGGRHGARAFIMHGAGIPAGRAPSARRQMGAGSVSADARHAAQPHRRPGRDGPDRPGDRPAARCLRGAGGLSCATTQPGGGVQALPEPRRHGP